MEMYEFARTMGYQFSKTIGYTFGIVNAVGLVISLVCYAFGSMGLCQMARRRGISASWLSWVPVLRAWIFGSISDQYRYVTRREIKSKRKLLLILEILVAVMGAAVTVKVLSFFHEILWYSFYGTEGEIMQAVFKGLPGVAGLALLGAVVTILRTVFHYMATYDLYASTDPSLKVIFLLASIFIPVTEPFFIFFYRNKDGGMPPRHEIPMAPVEPTPEPWDL